MRGNMTPAQATIAIAEQLFANHPSYRGTMAFEVMSMDTLEVFRRDAEAWLGDKSELDGDVYGLADWNELYDTFKNW
jgi:hypothetical protein